MNNTVNHVQINAIISYKKTRSINEYTARLSIFKNVNDGIVNEVLYLKGNDLNTLQIEVLKHWENVSTSFKKQFNLSFCNDRMTSYKYRCNKMIASITSYNLIVKGN